MVIDHRNGQNSLSKCLLLLSFSICPMPIPSKYLNFYFTVPPAVSTLTEQTSTIAKNLESTIDLSNLLLKYIPPETLFYRNMAFMQKSPFLLLHSTRAHMAIMGLVITLWLMISLNKRLQSLLEKRLE